MLCQRASCRDDLDEFWVKWCDPRQNPVQVLGGMGVVVADNQRSSGGTQFVQRRLGKFLNRLKFDIHQLKTGFGGL